MKLGVLHEYTKSLELDFFILKSSLLSLLGSAGQGNYTASSAFLDSMAAHRRAKGLPATDDQLVCLVRGRVGHCFGRPWRSDVVGARRKIRFSGSRNASVRQGDEPRRRTDRGWRLSDWPALRSQGGRTAVPDGGFEQNKDFRIIDIGTRKGAPSRIADSVNGQARQQLLSRLQQHITAELGFTEVLDPNERLHDLGVDSLMSVTLSNSLEKEFGIPVSVAELINGPTINQLVDGIFRELIGSFVTERNQVAEAAPNAIPMRAEIPERPPAADAGPPASNSGREFLSETKIFGIIDIGTRKGAPSRIAIAVNGQARQQLLSRFATAHHGGTRFHRSARTRMNG